MGAAIVECRVSDIDGAVDWHFAWPSRPATLALLSLSLVTSALLRLLKQCLLSSYGMLEPITL